jgi:hypothetical protein
MKMDDAIVEFGFDCKVRKLSDKTVSPRDAPGHRKCIRNRVDQANLNI